MNDVKIFEAFCCANCKNCIMGSIAAWNLYCLRHKEDDGSLLPVKLTDVCQWYQRKEEE